MIKKYTIKYVDIKTNNATYIDLKPMTLKQAYNLKKVQMDIKDRIVEIIPYKEYLNYKEEAKR